MLGEKLNAGSEKRRKRPVDVGARLRAAREDRKIDLRDIAETTKISIGALEALEQNDFGPLPGGIFTRAFVRAYANEVGLDPERTTRDFMAQAPVEADHDLAAQLDRDQMPSPKQIAETAVKLLVVGVPVAVLLFLGIRGLSRDAPAAEDAGAPIESAAPPAPARAAPVGVAAAPAVSAPLAIVLRPRGESWVALTVDGEVVVSRIMQAGDEESWEAEDEILLHVGNAGQFDFAVNNQDGRSLGGPGEVVNLRITPDNYRSYVLP